MELVIITAIVLFVITYTKMVDVDDLFDGNGKLGSLIKEKDYDFYAKAKYGGDVNISALFNKRIKTTGFVFIVAVIFLLFNAFKTTSKRPDFFTLLLPITTKTFLKENSSQISPICFSFPLPKNILVGDTKLKSIIFRHPLIFNIVLNSLL